MSSLIRIIGIFLAGALHTLALSPFDFWPASIVSIGLFLWLSKALVTQYELKPRKAVFYGWLYGFGLFASGASWVYVSINTYGNAPPALAGSLTLVFVAGLGLFHALMFWAFAQVRAERVISNALLFSAIWTTTDLFRTVFLTGFPWLFAGDSQLDGPLQSWFPLIGTYGITFILCLSSCALLLAFLERSKANLGLLASVVLLGWATPVITSNAQWVRDTGDSLQVALLQINIPQELKWTRSQRPKTIELLDSMTQMHLDKDVIFWPETALPMFYSAAKPLLKRFGDEANRNESAIVTGIPYRGFDPLRKTSVIHNSVTAIGNGQGIYHKQKLVPFGEYVPLQDLLRGLIAFFDLPMSNFRKGAEDQALLSTKGFSVSPFICYEVVYSDFVAERAKGADYLLTISNDSWFGRSIGPLQHLQLARIRALENGRYMVRATNNGVTAIINQKGAIEQSIPQFEQASLEGEVRIFEGETPFTRFGSVPTQILCVFIIAFAIFQKIRLRKQNR